MKIEKLEMKLTKNLLKQLREKKMKWKSNKGKKKSL